MNYQNKFWTKYFKHYDVVLRVIPYQELFTTIVKCLRLSKNIKLLDLGSGTGNLQNFIKNGSDVKVVNLDLSKEALDRLKLKFPDSATVVHSLKSKLPFNDNSFDRLVSNNVLYTLEKDEWNFVISEIERVTKPNSIVVISNLMKDFDVLNIYKDHIYKSINRNGVIATILELVKLIFPTVQLIHMN